METFFLPSSISCSGSVFTINGRGGSAAPLVDFCLDDRRHFSTATQPISTATAVVSNIRSSRFSASAASGDSPVPDDAFRIAAIRSAGDTFTELDCITAPEIDFPLARREKWFGRLKCEREKGGAEGVSVRLTVWLGNW